MNPTKTKNPSIRLPLTVSLTTCLVSLTGCALVSDILKPPPPPPPPPPAVWNSSPDFSPASINKIAIVTEGPSRMGWGWSGTQDSSITSVEDAFIEAAFRKGYQVSDRSDVAQVLEEINFQNSGLTEEAGAAKLGKMLNVPAVLIVKITSAGVNVRPAGYMINYVPQYVNVAYCTISTRLISVEKSEVLGLATYSAQAMTGDRNDAGPAVSICASRLAEALPRKN